MLKHAAEDLDSIGKVPDTNMIVCILIEIEGERFLETEDRSEHLR
jgi:hypothetical protein